MRSTKLPPPSESCEKKCREDMARECPRAAVASFRFSRSGRSPCFERATFRTHSVARTRARLLAVLTEALAELHAAWEAGAATRASVSANASARASLGKRIHYSLRNLARLALGAR